MTEAYGEMVMDSGRLDSVQRTEERRDWLRQLRKLANSDSDGDTVTVTVTQSWRCSEHCVRNTAG